MGDVACDKYAKRHSLYPGGRRRLSTLPGIGQDAVYEDDQEKAQYIEKTSINPRGVVAVHIKQLSRMDVHVEHSKNLLILKFYT